ncbi:MAG: twin-arginine translocase subunit TatC [Anaerolineae bacterium]|nr:MAG: twin-arginine translocase subunit TatC [Anaerolineae bacterium]
MTDQSETVQGQTILEHLNEFRIRAMWAAAGLSVGVVISFAFTQQLLNILIEPYGERLQTLSPTEGIQTYFRVALIAGVTIAMPWILYQLWRFISPGLHENERKYVYIFVPSATLLFLLGVAFAWFVLLPSAINFLSTFMPQIFSAEWTSQEYIGFATSFIFWMGISFQLPLIIYFLSRFGIVSSGMLREHWRIAIVGIAIIAAVVTPSIDPVTMLLTMLPLILLYLLSIVLASLGYRQFASSVALDEESVDTVSPD